jgi:hypothetical protein
MKHGGMLVEGFCKVNIKFAPRRATMRNNMERLERLRAITKQEKRMWDLRYKPWASEYKVDPAPLPELVTHIFSGIEPGKGIDQKLPLGGGKIFDTQDFYANEKGMDEAIKLIVSVHVEVSGPLNWHAHVSTVEVDHATNGSTTDQEGAKTPAFSGQVINLRWRGAGSVKACEATRRAWP